MAGNESDGIKFVETGKTDLSGFTLIEGFPGMGLIGTISTKYIVEKLGFEQIGHIASEMFVPIIRIHNGLPVHPSRIYVHKQKKLAALVSEQIIPQQYTAKLASSVVKWIQQKKIKRLISLSGIKAVSAGGGRKKIIYGIASNAKSKKLLKEFDVEVIKEGITTGVTALILLEMRDKNIEACSILGNVEIAADYKAAAELIKKLSEMLGLSIDVKPLLKEAKETEKALLDQLREMKNVGREEKKFGDKTQLETPMYT